MPDPALEEAIREAYASCPSDRVVLHTVELRHPAFVDDNGNPTAVRVVRNYEDEVTWRRIMPLIGGTERFRPPRVRDLAAMLVLRETDVRRLFKLLGRMGKVDEVAHDHFFLRGTVAEMVGIIVNLGAVNPDGQFAAAMFRDQVDNGRKVAIQILEYFDRHGVTLRRGDLRRVNKHRLDLFRMAEAGSAASQNSGRESSPVGRPDFKSGRGREPVLGGFDSLSLPPKLKGMV